MGDQGGPEKRNGATTVYHNGDHAPTTSSTSEVVDSDGVSTVTVMDCLEIGHDLAASPQNGDPTSVSGVTRYCIFL